MSEVETHHKVEMGSERNFGLVFAAMFALVGLWPLVGSEPVRWWALAVAVVMALVALLAPALLAPFNRLWFLFGLLLGRVIAPIVMMVVFFVAVTPTAVLARLLGKDFLLIDNKVRDQKSFWIKRETDPDHPPSMKNQF